MHWSFAVGLAWFHMSPYVSPVKFPNYWRKCFGLSVLLALSFATFFAQRIHSWIQFVNSAIFVFQAYAAYSGAFTRAIVENSSSINNCFGCKTYKYSLTDSEDTVFHLVSLVVHAAIAGFCSMVLLLDLQFHHCLCQEFIFQWRDRGTICAFPKLIIPYWS